MKRAFIATSFVLGFIAIGLLVYVGLNTPESHPNFPQEYVEGIIEGKSPGRDRAEWESAAGK